MQHAKGITNVLPVLRTRRKAFARSARKSMEPMGIGNRQATSPSNDGRPKRRGSEPNRPVQRTLECAGVPQRCGGRDGPPARPAERGRSLPSSGPRDPQACRRGPARHRVEGSGRCHELVCCPVRGGFEESGRFLCCILANGWTDLGFLA